jgi:hypothetical protein
MKSPKDIILVQKWGLNLQDALAMLALVSVMSYVIFVRH